MTMSPFEAWAFANLSQAEDKANLPRKRLVKPWYRLLCRASQMMESCPGERCSAHTAAVLIAGYLCPSQTVSFTPFRYPQS